MKTQTDNQTATAAPEAPTVNASELERMELIALDTRKMFVRVKGGQWSWCDRGDQHTLYGVFDTRFEALQDAVEPYLNED